MVEDYKSCNSSILVSKKYKISHTTILKWSNSETLENKSSSPKKPSRKHDFKKLVLIYFLYKKENKTLDEIEDILEKQ